MKNRETGPVKKKGNGTHGSIIYHKTRARPPAVAGGKVMD